MSLICNDCVLPYCNTHAHTRPRMLLLVNLNNGKKYFDRMRYAVFLFNLPFALNIRAVFAIFEHFIVVVLVLLLLLLCIFGVQSCLFHVQHKQGMHEVEGALNLLLHLFIFAYSLPF